MKIKFGSLSARRETAILKKIHALTKALQKSSVNDDELMRYLKPPLQYDYRSLADLKAYGLITIQTVKDDYSVYSLTQAGKAVVAQS